MTMRSADRSWRLFAAWAGATALTVFGFLAMWTIGLPFLMAGLGLAIWLVATGHTLPAVAAAAGVLVGMGAILLLIGVINLDYTPCSELDPSGGECGGWNPVPWLAAGSGLTIVGLAMLAIGKSR
jgi:hypothetical protein